MQRYGFILYHQTFCRFFFKTMQNNYSLHRNVCLYLIIYNRLYIYIRLAGYLFFLPVLLLVQASRFFFLVSVLVALISRAAPKKRKNYNVRYYTIVYDFSTCPSFRMCKGDRRAYLQRFFGACGRRPHSVAAALLCESGFFCQEHCLIISIL